MRRVVIDEASFRELVISRGVVIGATELILADIDTIPMLRAVLDGMKPAPPPPDPPEAREFLPRRRKN